MATFAVVRHILILSFVVIACLLFSDYKGIALASEVEDDASSPESYDDDLPMPSRYEDHYGGGDPYGGAPSSRGAKELISVDELKSFLSEDPTEPAVIGYFDVATNSNDKDVFDEVVSELGQSYRFAYTTAKEVLEEYKYDGCAVTAHRPSKYVNEKDEKVKSRYAAKILKKTSLLKFVRDKTLPLVGEINDKSEERYDNVGLPIVTFFSDNVDLQKNAKSFQYISNRARKIAKNFVDKLVFAIADKDRFSHEFRSYNFDSLGKKEIGVGIKAGNTYYTMDSSFSLENVRAFVDAFKAGKLVGVEKFVDKQDPASSGDEDFDSNVKQLTTSNFKEEVTSSSADALVEFYAPWCGHCKHLKPEMNKVAQHFAGDDSVSICAMDATAHNPPSGYEVGGYPTLYYVPADTKKPISYDGEREASAIISFIKEKQKQKKN